MPRDLDFQTQRRIARELEAEKRKSSGKMGGEEKSDISRSEKLPSSETQRVKRRLEALKREKKKKISAKEVALGVAGIAEEAQTLRAIIEIVAAIIEIASVIAAIELIIRLHVYLGVNLLGWRIPGIPVIKGIGLMFLGIVLGLLDALVGFILLVFIVLIIIIVEALRSPSIEDFRLLPWGNSFDIFYQWIKGVL